MVCQLKRCQGEAIDTLKVVVKGFICVKDMDLDVCYFCRKRILESESLIIPSRLIKKELPKGDYYSDCYP